jgi:hypothetical protein
MRKTAIVFYMLICLNSNGQQGRWKPFKLFILQPDTAIIDSQLFPYRDSVQAMYLRRYLKAVGEMERMLDGQYGDSSFKKEIRKELSVARAQEAKVRKFEYFQLVSAYSTEVYNFYFNEYEPYSTIFEAPHLPTELASISHFADSTQADYIIFFTHIRTFKEDGYFKLKLLTSLYAKRENGVIFSQETEGDMLSRGEMWTCDNDLACLLINGIKSSSDLVADILRKRQIR